MPLPRHYEVDIEVTVRVRDISGNHQLLSVTINDGKKGDSFNPTQALPVIATECLEEATKKVATHMEVLRVQEQKTL